MSDRSKRVQELFHRALDMPEGERSGYLTEACGGDEVLRGEVESLLMALEEAGSFLTRPAAATVAPEAPGMRIGRYRLLEEIGEGGFGVVWLAEQEEPVRRRVALKVIKLGMDTRQVVARFEAERQALAMMDHPNIAKVLDGGSTASGRPYFVMELVRGVPITTFCDQAGLDLSARVVLLEQVCDAVQHAHQKGVIHRDLKPSNILVTLQEGVPVPKVIDFGIAKATNQALTQRTLFTELRQVVGTPQYMAPEQADLSGLDVDTRADVYSLGVVLYELLTGTRPFGLDGTEEGAHAEVLRRIREVEPQRPSSRVAALGDKSVQVAQARGSEARRLTQRLQGDLDWITLRALEKDRSRRYSTARALAEDLRCYLEDLPVEAGPPSASYRLAKFVRRHRRAVASAVLVLLALFAGTIATAVALRRALEAEGQERTARQKAEENEALAVQQAALAKSVLAMTQEMLQAADPHNAKGPDYTVRELLDEFDAHLGDRLAGQPVAEAAIRTTMGSAYRNLGLLDKAEEHLEAAARLLSAEEATDGTDYADLLEHRAWLLHDRGDYAGARALAEEALAKTGGEGQDGGRRIAERMLVVADLERHAGRYGEAERMAREAMAKLKRVETTPSFAFCLDLLGMALEEQGRSREAEDAFRRSLSMRRALHGDRDPVVASTLTNLASSLERQGRHEEAEQSLLEALEIRDQLLPGDHPERLTNRNNLAGILDRQGRHEEAEALYREVLEEGRRVLGSDHLHVALTMGNLAGLLSNSGRLDEAERLLREALPVFRNRLEENHPQLATTLDVLGGLLRQQRKLEEAELVLRESLAMRRRAPFSVAEDLAKTLGGLALVLADQRRHTEAEDLLREGVAAMAETDPEHPVHITSLYYLGHVLAEQGKGDEAIEVLQRMVELQGQAGRERDMDTGRALQRIGFVRIARGELEMAERDLRGALAILDTGTDHPLAATTLFYLGHVVGKQGRRTEQSELLRKMIGMQRRSGRTSSPQTAVALHALAVALLAEDRHLEAERALRECMSVREGLGVDRSRPAELLGLLSDALAGQNRHAEAEELLLAARSELGQEPPVAELRALLERLVSLYEAWTATGADKAEIAARCRGELERLGQEDR